MKTKKIIMGALTIVGIIFTILAWIFPLWTKECIIIITLLIVIVILCIWIFLLYQQNKEEIIKPSPPKIPEPRFKRFEDIMQNKIKYGHIEYKPFFWQDETIPHGIGLEVLNTIFENKIQIEPCNYPVTKGARWTDILKGLCDSQFDIILTPLFETKTRICNNNVSYCTPLFYSNIGIWVRKELYPDNDKLKFKNAIQFIKKKQIWKPSFIKGEISESMIVKYFYERYQQYTELSNIFGNGDIEFANVLKQVNTPGRNGRNDNAGDFIFMEVFKAKSIINKNNNDINQKEKFELVNILADNELLYPVSFVVRKEE
jgi:hypothetical protein